MMKIAAKNKDRISELPESIIHQILSYLSNKEAAQTSALSKTWLQAWSTSPILYLSEYNFPAGSPKSKEYRHKFFNFVNNTLLRYHTQNLRINKFEILVYRVEVEHATAYRLLDESIKTALDHGVKELDISVLLTVKFSPYTLPPTFFSFANALTDLRVSQCKFPQNFASTSNAINFPILKTLNLRLAYIDDGMLEKLLSSCPSIEKVVFFRVLGFKKFVASNLGKLKVVDICSRGKAIEVDIQAAPTLHFLEYCGSSKMPCLLKVGSAQNLKHLELATVSITDNFLKELIIKFPLLEYLKLNTCGGLEKVNVSSRSLKHLHLVSCKKLVEAEIDAPNLLTFDYNGDMLSLSLYNTPEELMTYIDIPHFGDARLNNTWFHQLREMLKSIRRGNVSFSIWHQGVVFGTDLDSRVNPLPPENFMPEIDWSSSLFAVFLETLFFSSRPTTISSVSLAPPFVDFINFLGSELIMAMRTSYCCCSDHETKCWRHYLKDIKVEVCKNSQDGWEPLHLETLPVKSTFLDEKIRLSLKWNANLNDQD